MDRRPRRYRRSRRHRGDDHRHQLESGRFGWTVLAGKLSGYSRRALVYMPLQYGEARYAQVRFPVVELFHGTPGSPLTWDNVLQVNRVADTSIARHVIGPMVLVMPSINGAGGDYQDCVNGPHVNDDTYLTQDVRADVLAHYRVSHDPYPVGRDRLLLRRLLRGQPRAAPSGLVRRRRGDRGPTSGPPTARPPPC